MKRVISYIVTIAMVMTLFTGAAFANPGNGNGNGKHKEFKDMKGHWGKQSVEKMQSLGILGGYTDGTFQPDKALTQAELAVIIDRLLELKGDGDDDQWTDDDDDDDDDDKEYTQIPKWAKKAVKKGINQNYFNLKRFHSHVQVDRLTASVAIAKALKLEPITDFENNPFKDLGMLNDEDFGYLLALYEEGYIKGYPNGTFNPYSLLSRAQMAAIIENLIDPDDEDSDDETAPEWDSDSTATATDIRATVVDLKWSAATDDEGVVGYKVSYELDDVDKVKYVSGRTATISGLEEDEVYTFTVEAKDAAGNWSDDGPSVEVTTLNQDEEDSDDPYWSDDSAITATAIRTNSVDLKWSRATDDEGVVGYKVSYELDGADKVKYVSDRTVRIKELESDEEYTFTVEAKDAAGNWSNDGPSVKVTTLEEEVADTSVPTWPSGAVLTVSPSVSGVVTLVWPDADDNVGIASYKVYQDGQLIHTMVKDANSVNVSGLSTDTEYIFKVRAFDAAGNMSTSLSKTYLTE
jgi:chitodextrinase